MEIRRTETTLTIDLIQNFQFHSRRRCNVAAVVPIFRNAINCCVFITVYIFTCIYVDMNELMYMYVDIYIPSMCISMYV